MPPKRRAAAAKAGGKKAKQEATPKPKDAFTSAKEALLAAGPQVKGTRKVDEHCSLSSCGEVRKMPYNLRYPQSMHSLTAMQMGEVTEVTCKRKMNVLIFVLLSPIRCMKTMTACSIRQTLDITIISFMSFKLSKQATSSIHGTDGAEW